MRVKRDQDIRLSKDEKERGKKCDRNEMEQGDEE